MKPGWTRLTLTDDRPFTLTAVSACTVNQLRITLSWSDPSDGLFTSCQIERASADSQWVAVGNVLPPDQYFTDVTLSSLEPVRYRVTLTTPSGMQRQLSDAVTPIPEENVDFLEMLIPGDDWILRYQYRQLLTRDNVLELDTTLSIEYRYLGAYDSTRWIRVYPFKVTETAGTGEQNSRIEQLLEFRGPTPYFTQFDTPQRSVFDMRADLAFLPPESADFFDSHSPHPVNMPVCVLINPTADSVIYTTDHPRPLGSHNYRNTAKRGIGIQSRRGGLWASMSVSSESWVLVEHVNSSPQTRPSASGLRLSSYPNPFTGAATVTFAVVAAGPVRLSVHDMLGREVAILREGRVEAGSYSIPFSASGLPSGMYVARIQASGEVVQRLLTCVR